MLSVAFVCYIACSHLLKAHTFAEIKLQNCFVLKDACVAEIVKVASVVVCPKKCAPVSVSVKYN